MYQFFQNLWIDKMGLYSIFIYMAVSLPLAIIMLYVSIYKPSIDYIKKNKIKSIQKLFTREFYQEKNTALPIFIWSRIVSISIIISNAMVFNIFGVVIFSVFWYLLQELVVKIFQKIFWIDDMIKDILDNQNLQISIFYAFVSIGLSILIWAVMI